MFCWKYILLVLSVQYVCFAQTDYNAFSGEERDARRQLRRLDREYKTNTRKSLPRRGDCRTQDLAIRREWGDLSDDVRLDYINAVKCLHELPAKIGSDKAPGAKSRYDDFVASHIINTRDIHATGSFFAWHRHHLLLFETALRDECGYSGYQPYWDWSKYANVDPELVPLYDGSRTSMSGNGKFIPNRNASFQPIPIPADDPPAFVTPPGTGGGFIEEGPFKDWRMSLGPVIPVAVENAPEVPPNPREDGLGFNPRPLIRDFNNTLLQESASYPVVADIVGNSETIETFDEQLFTRPHLAGHLFISAIDNDLFTSTNDPLFWFHHAQVDRLWSIWQALDFETRELAIAGTVTILNAPPSRKATLDDHMDFEFSPSIPIREAMSPTKNGYCYMYR